MRLSHFLCCAFAVSAGAAQADSHYSELIRSSGITGATAQLSALPDPTPSDQFALGGLHFLGAVEAALQTRYDHDMNSDTMAMMADLPFLRLPVAPNPAPKPFAPQVIEDLFTAALTDLDASLVALDQITDADHVAVTIRPSDLWFDINASGARDPGETVGQVVSGIFGDAGAEIDKSLMIQFDTADAAWLSAYAHMLSGMSHLILSTDPQQAVAAVFDGARQIDAVRGDTDLQWGFFSNNELGELDAIAAMIVALEGPIDATHTRAAHQHFLDGLTDNRTFWHRVEAETDNALEWIPNDTQTSALPLQFPAGIGTAWQAVLSDAESVLTGDLLLPFWRIGPDAGLNLAKIMQNPPSVDIIGLFQGYSLAPYAQRGPVINWTSLSAFDDMTGGNSPFFAILLN